MNRRSLLTALAALPGLGWLRRRSTIDTTPVAPEDRYFSVQPPPTFQGVPRFDPVGSLPEPEVSGQYYALTDRLWVGPERQAWLDNEYRDAEPFWNCSAPLDPTLARHRNDERTTWTYAGKGVDGRWRWAQDLGIEPR